MRGSRSLARALAAVLLGIAALLAVSRYALSVDLGSAFARAAALPLPVLALAAALRGVGLLIHAAQFYMVAESYGCGLSFRRTLLLVYSSLSLEYAVPVGGAVEVGRVALLVREGLSPGRAVELTFAHRLAHSVSAAVEVLLVALLLRRVDAVVLWLLAAVAAANAVNLAALASARSRRVLELLERLASRLGARWTVPSFARRPRAGPLCAALALIGLEKASTVLSGHAILSGLGYSADPVYSLVIFDALLVTFWLLPVVTPAGIGQVEVAQLVASAAMGLDPEVATAAVILYRLATLVAVLPQLAAALLSYGVGRVLGEARAEPSLRQDRVDASAADRRPGSSPRASARLPSGRTLPRAPGRYSERSPGSVFSRRREGFGGVSGSQREGAGARRSARPGGSSPRP